MSDEPTASAPERKCYFVDEAGDHTLFGSRGKVLVGSEGCSRFFTLGFADVEETEKLSADLTALRTRLLTDPYFKDVPSMQPEEKKDRAFVPRQRRRA